MPQYLVILYNNRRDHKLRKRSAVPPCHTLPKMIARRFNEVKLKVQKLRKAKIVPRGKG